MEETYTAQAIILNRQNFRENDSIVAVYTEKYGKLELVARGTKKILSKLGPHIEPITLTNIMVVKGKQFDYIGGAVNRESFYQIKNDLEKTQAALKALNIFNRLIKKNEAEAGLFLLLAEYLLLLNSGKNIDLELFNVLFLFLLLCKLGYTPELNSCVSCKKKNVLNHAGFNYAKGGIECEKCGQNKNTLTIGINCVKVLQFAAKNNLTEAINLKITGNTKNQIIKAISSFYKYNYC